MKLKFPDSYKTQVFHTASGHIRIEQTCEMGEEAVALLSPDQAEQLITGLPKLIELARLELEQEDE